MEDFNFNIDALNFDLGFGLDEKFKSRYYKPPKSKEYSDSFLKYEKAEKAANEINLGKDQRIYAILSGNFIFGDFIEAFVVKNNYHIKNLIISTLSLNQNNVDSLKNLIVGNFVDNLDLIISDYFYSHERFSLLPYIYETLDIEGKFQLAAAGSHCKITLIQTHCGKKFVFHGSSNLRSSSCIEQVCFEENESLYDFNLEYQNEIIKIFKTINKSVRGGKLWQAVQMDQEKNEVQVKKRQQEPEGQCVQ